MIWLELHLRRNASVFSLEFKEISEHSLISFLNDSLLKPLVRKLLQLPSQHPKLVQDQRRHQRYVYISSQSLHRKLTEI